MAKQISKYPDKHFSENLMVKQLAKHEYNIRMALKIHGKEVTTVLRSSIKNSRGSGTHYLRLPNRSSAPNEHPVSQSGKLLKGFGYRTRTNELLVFNRARSKDGAPYPAFLNEGTKKMEPRQYFDSQIEAMAGWLQADLMDFKFVDLYS